MGNFWHDKREVQNWLQHSQNPLSYPALIFFTSTFVCTYFIRGEYQAQIALGEVGVCANK